MPTVVTENLTPPIPPRPLRKRWTRVECDALESAGMLGSQRVELIEGELIDKMGKGRPHVEVTTLLFVWLIQVFGGRFVNQEAPIDVAPNDNPTNEPQPDLIVLRPSYSSRRSAAPQPNDLELVIEVSDTSLDFDRTVKARLYARAGIMEYWIVDVQGRRLIVHREPQSGAYVSVVSYGEHERVTPLAAPGAEFAVSTVFPG